MVYRYRLRDCPENESLNSRIIHGTKLVKDRWLMSETPIDFGGFKRLVEEESANKFSEFSSQNSETRESERIRKLEEKAKTKREPIDWSSRPVEEAYKEARRLGFPKEEIPRKKGKIVELIRLDSEISPIIPKESK